MGTRTRVGKGVETGSSRSRADLVLERGPLGTYWGDERNISLGFAREGGGGVW